MNICIASDHAGFDMKQKIVDYLRENHATWEITDMGPENDTSVDYPIYAHRVAGAVSRGEFRRGILLCGTGLGMSMMANRFLGVRAALCTFEEMAELSRQHNRANILCLAARKVDFDVNAAIVDKWLKTGFEDDARHERRISLMDLLISR
ncbi:MAG: ribose 5-phosphate isomerase B [Desulfosudaceae bacterium]